jgi:acetylglutamate kinase
MSATDSELQARLLAQALPYMQRYENKTIVVKYGGHAMGEEKLGRAFARDIVLLEQTGDQPGRGARRRPADRRDAQQDGHRIASSKAGCASPTQKTVEIVEMVLAGSINKEIVSHINQTGEGRSDCAARTATWSSPSKAKKTMVDPDSNIERVVDLGFVGEPVESRPDAARPARRKSEMIPVSRRSRPAATARPTTSTPTPLPARSPAR